ncbi:MAG: type II 3-dehydroquinate dehydratase, partial [Oscillospiraceae bacterium]|nr:type II 3-dehydroquinate dehydratase [Oscillospiraceae bacterium]
MILNGANINLLGVREPDIYGREDYATLLSRVRDHAEEL